LLPSRPRTWSVCVWNGICTNTLIGLNDHLGPEQNGGLQTDRSVNYFVNQFTLERNMNGIALQILKEVEKRGEVSLSRAIRLGGYRHKDHLDQYPLALLLEEGYLGMTINHTPPSGAEEMGLTRFPGHYPKPFQAFSNSSGLTRPRVECRRRGL